MTINFPNYYEIVALILTGGILFTIWFICTWHDRLRRSSPSNTEKKT